MPDEIEAPVILDRYANTSSAGSVIAFHLCRDDMPAGDIGVLCSFGAGYSIGSLVIRKLLERLDAGAGNVGGLAELGAQTGCRVGGG